MNQGKAVVFDMDGVIFDTERLVVEAWQVVADRHGIPDVEAACRECLGLNQTEAEKRFVARYGEDFDYWKYKTEMRSVYWNDLYGEHMPIKPGAEELLKALKAEGIPVALASSTRREAVHRELTDAGLIGYFDRIICGDMVTKSKPDPEIFLTACAELGQNPADTWAIEDSFAGIRAAHGGGLMPIMVPDRMEPTPEIAALTVAVCRSLHEVRRMWGLS